MQLNPQSILDIGAGFGKYGVLCREYLEYWGTDAALNWKRKIDAVEVFPAYITPLHRYIYNNIYQQNVLDIIHRLKDYDLVLFIDVLEHFTKIDGEYLIKMLVLNNKSLLISTPKQWNKQDDVFGNEYERHKTLWTEDEFRVFGTTGFIEDDRSIICHIQKPH
jgi:2-polyprenyl-3-methyl-5-hydroxy-6-metoxy-1,4-benzoquinol methylase